ncbi:putative transporter ESBP6 [Smittium culicis]|uniref:Putative transporter ESBP6 n=1 Tax=Smittium culicis TaxID=133412 RepID=A0A1R1XVY3_9FUNG|nr:putative transporter ESBP6 [Smittium culicis]
MNSSVPKPASYHKNPSAVDFESTHESHSLDEKRKISEPDDGCPPPDKGYAWVILASSLVNFLFSFGSPNAFGVFQAYYLKVLFVDEPAEKIAWISTMCIACTLSGGLLASPLIRLIGLRNSSLLGTVIASVGLLLASFSTQIWQLTLTQGIMFGLGSSIIANIALTVPALWFDKHKGLAIGIVASGSSIGALVLVPVVTVFVNILDIHWAFRILAILFLVCTGICGFFLKPRKEYLPSNKLIDLASLKDPAALMIYAVGVFMQVGFNVVALYFPANLIDVGKSPATASNLIMVYCAFSSISRMACGPLTKKFDAVNIALVSHFLTGVLMLTLWLTSKTFVPLLIFYICFGLFAVPFFALGPLIIASYYPIEKVSQINGVAYLAMGLTIFACAPTTGAIFENLGHRTSYKPIIILGGIFYLASLFPLIALKYFLKRDNPNFRNNTSSLKK